MFDRLLDGVLRYLVENDAMHCFAVQRAFFFQQFDQVPGNGFAFAIRVRCEIERVGFLQGAHDCVDVFLAALDDLVLHREFLVGIHGALLRNEVAHVAVRRHHLEIPAEVFADGFRLCGRFDDDKILGHRMKNRGQCRG
jgi:hypothetical protein